MISSSRLRNSGRKCARTTSITCGSTSSTVWSSVDIREVLAAEVAGQDDQRVGEIDLAALPVGQAPVVEHLQQHVEHVGMRLLDLVEQHHLVGPAPHRFGQHAAFLITDIARRRADQAGDRVLFHEFATCRCGPSRCRRRTGTRRAPWSARSCRRRSGRGTGSCRAAGSDPAGRRAHGARPWTRPRPPAPGRSRACRCTSSIWSSFSRSPSIILSTGMPVQRLTTPAMSSSVTSSRSSAFSVWPSASASFFSSSGMLAVGQLARLGEIAGALRLLEFEPRADRALP